MEDYSNLGSSHGGAGKVRHHGFRVEIHNLLGTWVAMDVPDSEANSLA